MCSRDSFREREKFKKFHIFTDQIGVPVSTPGYRSWNRLASQNI